MKIAKSVLHYPERAFEREWLVTNGIGGYASSTVVGANTRRYHGLLVAPFPPPLERQVLLAKVDEELTVGGKTYPLGTNEYWDSTIHPQGYRSISTFRLELGIPTWEFTVGGMLLQKQIWMEQGSNTVYVMYRLVDSPGDVCLSVRPFCTFRGYHSVGNCGLQIADCISGENAVSLTHRESGVSLDLCSTASFYSAPDTYRSFLYRTERERGFSDCTEDLYTPGVFTAEMHSGDIFGIVGSSGESRHDAPSREALLDAYEREIGRRRHLVGDAGDSLHGSLVLAAEQFVVRPPSRVGDERSAVYAGYHWFTDWGRDTMISLPGLLLSTGRLPEAREILLAHGASVKDGLIPNRITDDGGAEYNTVDASLWYFEAIAEYIRTSSDSAIIDMLYPALERIVESHMRGTLHGIRVCADGLLHAGMDGTQLTWMDSRVDGVAITPRVGKPVEVNALWYNALCLMCSWAMHIGKPSMRYEIAAAKCLTSFGQRFWNDDLGCLYDVVDTLEGDDSSMRPNQIIAVSLPNSPLDCRRRRFVVDAVTRDLLTPYGLRTLSPHDPRYCARYAGGPSERDSAYHQGTVWPWLLGHYAEAHYRVYRNHAYIRQLQAPFRKHLTEAGVGGISEVFDGNAPHRPGGCVSQAWSVAELLRILAIGH